jgi:hypothetical protein
MPAVLVKYSCADSGSKSRLRPGLSLTRAVTRSESEASSQGRPGPARRRCVARANRGIPIKNWLPWCYTGVAASWLTFAIDFALGVCALGLRRMNWPM